MTFNVPVFKLITYGRRSFEVAAPELWNKLPDFLTDFKLSLPNFESQLETYFMLLISLSTVTLQRDGDIVTLRSIIFFQLNIVI